MDKLSEMRRDIERIEEIPYGLRCVLLEMLDMIEEVRATLSGSSSVKEDHDS